MIGGKNGAKSFGDRPRKSGLRPTEAGVTLVTSRVIKIEEYEEACTFIRVLIWSEGDVWELLGEAMVLKKRVFYEVMAV